MTTQPGSATRLELQYIRIQECKKLTVVRTDRWYDIARLVNSTVYLDEEMRCFFMLIFNWRLKWPRSCELESLTSRRTSWQGLCLTWQCQQKCTVGASYGSYNNCSSILIMILYSQPKFDILFLSNRGHLAFRFPIVQYMEYWRFLHIYRMRAHD